MLKRDISQIPLRDLISAEVFMPRGECILPVESNKYFRIPPHQRFPSWPLAKKQKLVDSVLRNYPIHAIIMVRKLNNVGLEVDEFCDIEDGQTRMTALQEYLLDGFACDSGDNSIGMGCKFSELPFVLQQQFLNYQVTREVFHGRQVTDEHIAEIFNRLNSGKPLSDNDKFYSRDKTPIMRAVNGLSAHPELREDFNRFIGSIGTKKTRTGLSDMVGAVLALTTHIKGNNSGGKACITTSYELNHRYLGDELTPAIMHTIVAVFRGYFAMLHRVTDKTTTKIRKNYGKLSGILGLYICHLLENHVNLSEIDWDEWTMPAIEWYAGRILQNPKYIPHTFNDLTKGDIRNCQGGSVSRRLQKIVLQYNTNPDDCQTCDSDDEDDTTDQ